MVATPAAALATATWQAVLSDPVHIADIREQTFQSHSLLRFAWAKEKMNAEEFRNATGKRATPKNGYDAQHMAFGPASRLQFDMNVDLMSTTGAIAPSASYTTSIDNALPPNPLRMLSGGYGLVYGTVPWGLEQEMIFGGEGGANVNRWLPVVKKDLAQSLSNSLSTNIYSNGGSNQFDGLAYWRATSGTKWNSNNIASTDTFLQGQALSSTVATFSYQTWLEWLDQCQYGDGIGTISQGNRPTIAIVTQKLFRLFKEWIVQKITINEPNANNEFVKYGLGNNEYLLIDGVVVFKDDVGLASDIGTDWAVGYLFDPSDLKFCFFNKGEFGFNAVDAGKMDGQAAGNFTRRDLPNYLFKSAFVKMILCNMIHMRPRNLGYFVIAN
jgi:hypothetical protein